jgi:large subunit ribosomal protein L21
MYAIVEIADKQFQVEKDRVLHVPLLNNKVGDKLELDRVLLYSDGSKVEVGNPVIKGAKVSAEVVGHDRDKKVIVFRKKRRKGFKVKRGHRQHFTTIRITKLSA